LASTTTSTYDQLGQGVNFITENYTYGNSDNIQVTQKVSANSKNDQITTNYSYPADEQSSGTPNIYNEMMSRHMWSNIIETSTYKNTNTFLEAGRTTYRDWGSGMIAPETIDTKKGAND